MRKLITLLIVAAMMLTPVQAVAQSCDIDPELPGSYVLIDGVRHAYVPLDEFRESVRRLQLFAPMQSKIEVLTRKVELLEQTDALRLNQVALLTDQSAADHALIDRLSRTSVPLLKQPVLNFVAGVLLTGTLFTFWQLADQ